MGGASNISFALDMSRPLVNRVISRFASSNSINIYPINVYTIIINVNTKIEPRWLEAQLVRGFTVEIKNPAEYQRGFKKESANS